MRESVGMEQEERLEGLRCEYELRLRDGLARLRICSE